MNHRTLHVLLIAALVITVTSTVSQAGNWPQFRGPLCNGVVEGDNLPLTWSEQENVRWRVNLPGEGWSSPVVWGDRIFVTTAEEDTTAKAARIAKEQADNAGDDEGEGRRGRGGGRGRRGNRDGKPPETLYRCRVHCLDAATGKSIWTQIAHEGQPSIPKHRDNTYATETPVTDGERVIAYFGMTGLFCYDMNGKLLWKKDLGAYKMQAGFGTASAPVLHNNAVFLQIDNEEESFVVAIDGKTGAERWRIKRDEGTNWCSPIIWQNAARAELVLGGKVTRSYDPANGKLLWHLDMGGGRSSASPVGNERFLYVGTEERRRGGEGGGTLFAVKAGASGDITPPEGQSTSSGVAWSRPKSGPPAASPIVYRGHLYTLGRRGGRISCFNAATGEPAYERESIPNARGFWASPWAYDGHVFCLDENGSTHVIAAGSDFKVLASNSLDGRFWATPSIANGQVLIRDENELYCIKR